MGHMIKDINQSYIPEEIRETQYFQDCASQLPHLPGNAVDHAGVYQCEAKTGELIAQRRWIKQHPHFTTLAHYTNQLFERKPQSPEEVIDKTRTALTMLDRGRSMEEAGRFLSRGLHLEALPSSMAAAKENLGTELEPIVITAQTSDPTHRFEESLQTLSKNEVEALQKDCVEIWAHALQRDQGMDAQQAKRAARGLLGPTGVDKKIGPQTRILLSLVLEHLSVGGKIDLDNIRDAKHLGEMLQAFSVSQTVGDLFSSLDLEAT